MSAAAGPHDQKPDRILIRSEWECRRRAAPPELDPDPDRGRNRVAEGVGFEPTKGVNPYGISSAAH